MEGGEEDTEDRSDNLVVVAFDEANSSNGSLDEVTGDTHPIDATSATGGSSSFNLATGPGSKKSSKLHMNHESSRENENSNSQTGDIQSVNKKGTTGKGVESEVEAKLRTRERLLAALTSLNGVAGVGRCKQNSSTSNNTTSSNGNTSTIGNSCNSPQPLSPSVSDICTKDEEEDEEDDEEGEGLLAMHAKDANGDFDPERLKAFNVIQFTCPLIIYNSLFRTCKCHSFTNLLTVFYFLSTFFPFTRTCTSLLRLLLCADRHRFHVSTWPTDVRATLRR